MAKLNVIDGWKKGDKIWIEDGHHRDLTRFWFFRGPKDASAGEIKDVRLGRLDVEHSYDSPMHPSDWTDKSIDFIPWVLEVWVDDNARRQGIATQLYLTAIEYFGMLVSADIESMESYMPDLWLSLPYRGGCVRVEQPWNSSLYWSHRYVGVWTCGKA